MTMSTERDLINNYISMVIKTLIDNIQTILHKGSFNESSLTFYGTPAFTEFEAMIIRVVTKDYHDLKLLV